MENSQVVTIIDLPNEVLDHIFKSVDARSLPNCSKVCRRWYHIIKNICPKSWEDNCKRDIRASTLKQILDKTPISTNLLSWKQLFMSWHYSTYDPKAWTLEKKDSFAIHEYDESVMIFKGNIIVFGAFQVKLYSLETHKLVGSCDDTIEYANLGIIELNNKVYFVHCFSMESFHILELEGGNLNLIEDYMYSEAENTKITSTSYHNNYVAMVIPDISKLAVVRLDLDPDSKSLIFNTVILKHVNRIHRVFFWDDKLVVITVNDLSIHSFNNETLNMISKFDLPYNYKYRCETIGDSLILGNFYPEILLEVYKEDVDEYNYRQFASSASHYRFRRTKCFANKFYAVRQNHLKPTHGYDDLEMKRIKLENTKDYLHNYEFDMCFYGDKRIIVYASNFKIYVETYKIVPTTSQ